MTYTSVLYKDNDKVYIGVLDEEKDLKEISSFKRLPYYRNIEVKDNVMYVVMVDQNLRIYELDNFTVSDALKEDESLSEFDMEDIVMLSNRLLKRYQDNLQYH